MSLRLHCVNTVSVSSDRIESKVAFLKTFTIRKAELWYAHQDVGGVEAKVVNYLWAEPERVTLFLSVYLYRYKCVVERLPSFHAVIMFSPPSCSKQLLRTLETVAFSILN